MSFLVRGRAKDLLLETGMFGQTTLDLVGGLEDRLLTDQALPRELDPPAMFRRLLGREIKQFVIVRNENLQGLEKPEWMTVERWLYYQNQPDLIWKLLVSSIEYHFPEDKVWVVRTAQKKVVEKAVGMLRATLSSHFPQTPLVVHNVLQRVCTHYLLYAVTEQQSGCALVGPLLNYFVPFIPLGTLKTDMHTMLLYQF